MAQDYTDDYLGNELVTTPPPSSNTGSGKSGSSGGGGSSSKKKTTSTSTSNQTNIPIEAYTLDQVNAGRAKAGATPIQQSQIVDTHRSAVRSAVEKSRIETAQLMASQEQAKKQAEQNRADWDTWAKNTEIESNYYQSLNRIQDYKSDNGYDLVRYLRDNPNAEGVQTLKNAGFQNEDVNKAQIESLKTESLESFTDRYLAKNYKDKDYTESNLKDRKKLDNESYDEYYKRMATKDEVLRKATKAYTDKYGKGALALTGAARAGEIVVAPAFRALRPEVAIGDITKAEWAWTAIFGATTFIPATRGIAAEVRAGTSTGKAIQKIALAEIKAPFTMVTDPIGSTKSGLKSLGDIGETVVRTDKIPIEALEIRTSTVRIPVSKTGLGTTEAKELRSNVVTNVIKSDGTKATIKNTSVDLTPTALNKTSPAAVHASPDVRPFLEGAEIKTKYKPGTTIPMSAKEQGLFVAPNLHTRFTKSSAFGLSGGKSPIPGALIIRDEKILNTLQATDKIYIPKGSKVSVTEIESKLPVGINLPKPSQKLITRNMQNQKITLLVFGKPFTRAEIAQMKLIGAVDTVKNIFSPAYKLSKTGVSKEVDELAKTGNKIKTLEQDLKQAKLKNNKRQINRIENSLEDAKAKSRRLSDKIDTNYKSSRLNSVAIYTGDNYLVRSREDILRDNPTYARSSTNRSVTSERIGTTRNEQSGPDNRSSERVTKVTDNRTNYDNDRQPGNDRKITPDNRTPDNSKIREPDGRTPESEEGRTPDNRTPETRTFNESKGKFKPDIEMESKQSERTAKDRSNAVTWKQGIGYWIVYPDKSTEWSKDKPEGVREIPGPDKNKPNATIQVYKPQGKTKRIIEFDADMGIQDIKVRKSGNKIIDIRFKQDRNRMTSNPVKLRFKSEKRGKIYHTRVGKGEVISRRPL